MTAHPDRDQLAPPSPPGRGRAVVLAVLVHAALIGALTWGVNWTPTAEQPAVVAELWSSVPQEAAPRAVEPPPPPPPPPAAPPETAPRPAPPPKPPVAEPDPREAQIAIEKEKERKRLEQEKREREQKERERKERERADKEKKERELKERELKERQQKEREQKERDERRQAEAKKVEQQKAEQERQKKQAEERRKAEDARRADELRQEQLRRIQGLANATGGENAKGTAERSSGPSGSYGGRVAARVKPNIVYPEVDSGNPQADVEVRAAPDGTITGIRVVKSSGNKAWDDAVVRALQRTETLPRDVDGRVPPSLVISFRPKD